MKTLIENYRHIPGEHCASVAMRNLVYHYSGLELSEPEVFGLGSGIDFIFLKSEQNDPGVVAFGRGISMEVDFASALGIDYRENPDFDDQHAWETAREEVSRGRPTMLSGDQYYLDHMSRDHFPAHRFVLLGFDDDRQTAIIADRLRVEYEECSYDKLALSRNPPSIISTYNLWGKFYGSQAENNINDALAVALKRTVRRMLGDDDSQIELISAFFDAQAESVAGLKGLAAYRDSFLSWRERRDCSKIVKYSSSCIEKYGTGGGNFRKMYADFLETVSRRRPDLVDADLIQTARDAASDWTKLSKTLWNLTPDSEDRLWRECLRIIEKILDTETELFEGLEKRIAA